MNLGITPNFTVTQARQNSNKQNVNKQNPNFGMKFVFTEEGLDSLMRLRKRPDSLGLGDRKSRISGIMDLLGEFNKNHNFFAKDKELAIQKIEDYGVMKVNGKKYKDFREDITIEDLKMIENENLSSMSPSDFREAAANL